tara:strand:+ start:325 stop:588 length:264 start_codon:yes stop_codon:yes gene_type:complete
MKTVLTILESTSCNNPMGWADWMQVVPTTEEAFELERSVREVNSCTDEEALKMLCSALVRQSWHQSKLLSQAVGRIGELDAKIACWD